jgi:hypothetical protein
METPDRKFHASESEPSRFSVSQRTGERWRNIRERRQVSRGETPF